MKKSDMPITNFITVQGTPVATSGYVTVGAVDRSTLQTVQATAGTVGAAAMAYHGYKRTGSVAWAAGWVLFGGFLPILAIPVALAQGFGKKKRK